MFSKVAPGIPPALRSRDPPPPALAAAPSAHLPFLRQSRPCSPAAALAPKKLQRLPAPGAPASSSSQFLTWHHEHQTAPSRRALPSRLLQSPLRNRLTFPSTERVAQYQVFPLIRLAVLSIA